MPDDKRQPRPAPQDAEVQAIIAAMRAESSALRISVDTGYSSPGIYRGAADRIDALAERVAKLRPAT